MGAYILRRLLLIIPTLLGIMLLNFGIVQFAPGGPVEQQIAELTGLGGSASDRFSGGGADAGASSQGGGEGSRYRGTQGLDPEFVAELEAQFGFVELVCEPGYDGPRKVSADECSVKVICEPGYTGEQTASAAECEAVRIPWYKRFANMVWDYIRFDFGDSYFRSISVIDLILEKMPVSVSLGLWTTLIAYLISIPMGVQKAVRDGSGFDTWTSAVVIVGYAIPAFLFAVMLRVFFAGGSFLQIFPLRGLESEEWLGQPFLAGPLFGLVGQLLLVALLVLIILVLVAGIYALMERGHRLRSRADLGLKLGLFAGAAVVFHVALVALGAGGAGFGERLFTGGLIGQASALGAGFGGVAAAEGPLAAGKALRPSWWADYFWHLVLPVAAMVIGSFATMTLLTKNSFLDEIRKQYVLTARAKGLSENGVLFGHVFRNAMLIIVAGFPTAFVGVFFTGSLLIENIFSLDGLGLLAFNSIIERDYPVVFGTLYMFSLIGLLLNLISDLVYVWIDPRIDFESRGG